jgi:hypothetical protein
MALRWEKQRDGESWYAYSGDLVIGMVVKRDHGEAWVYNLDAVHTRWIAKGHGEVETMPSAKRAIERAWAAWLERAGLEPRKDPTP